VTDNRITDPMAFPSDGTKDMLTPVLHEGARRMLALAIETEVAEWIERRSSLVDDKGRRLVVRNGHQPTRRIQTGLGDIEVARPRVHDRRAAPERETFRSRVLPPYLRRTKAIEQMLPWLYLKGISTGGFAEALQSLLGPDAAGLSASTITRLMEAWQKEHDEWSKRSLVGCEYVYVWADGIYFNVRLGDESTGKTQCILVLVGATRDGRKELIAVVEGYRESEQSWTELINDVKRRGLAIDPKLAVADGALGFWAAVGKAWPTTRAQRCWVHKTANVLNKLPKGMQPKAKDRLHEIWMAATRKEAVAALEAFVQDFGARYESAVACLEKDRDELLAFYDFPAEHWRHLRTTNPIESTFSTVRLRHRRTKGNGSREACLAMVFKLAQSAERHWRRLNGHELLQHVIRGVRFIDGTIDKVAA
jgi:transposase-like protein